MGVPAPQLEKRGRCEGRAASRPGRQPCAELLLGWAFRPPGTERPQRGEDDEPGRPQKAPVGAEGATGPAAPAVVR